MDLNNQQICAKSRDRKTSVRVELLNNQNLKVDELTGNIIDGSITIKNSLESNFSRRSGSITLELIKALSTQYYKIDLLHKVRIIVIVTDNITGAIAEYNLGIFTLGNPNLSQSIGDQKITLSLLDLMSNYDGFFGKSIDDIQTANIESGSNIGTAIYKVATDSTLMNLPSDKVKIESTTLTTIENISVEPSANCTDLLKAIMEDANNYDLYFDYDGILVFEHLKNRVEDIVFQEFINSDMVVSYEINEDFGNVRNHISCLGSQLSDGTQIQGLAELTDETHPLSVSNIGIRPMTITNDKLQTVDQAVRQAQYELQNRVNYNEKISLSILPDFRLQPNKKIRIQYVSFDENLEIKDGYYLIDEISIDFKVGGLMNLVTHKIYPNIIF